MPVVEHGAGDTRVAVAGFEVRGAEMPPHAFDGGVHHARHAAWRRLCVGIVPVCPVDDAVYGLWIRKSGFGVRAGIRVMAKRNSAAA